MTSASGFVISHSGSGKNGACVSNGYCDQLAYAARGRRLEGVFSRQSLPARECTFKLHGALRRYPPGETQVQKIVPSEIRNLGQLDDIAGDPSPSSRKALEINTSAGVFGEGEIGGSHEALAVRPGSFRRYRLHRIPSVGSVCFSKRSVNQNKRSSKRLSCFYLAPYRNPPGPSDLGW
jgi:hypothetical protein